MRDPNAWRYALDPRDPDYEEPPEEQYEMDLEPDADDGRVNDGPYHYVPKGAYA